MLVFGVIEIDEIDIIVISVFGGSNGPNRKRTPFAAKTSKGFLLLGNIADDIGTFTRRVVCATTAKTFPIQFRHCEVIRSFKRRVIVKGGSLRGSFECSNIAITRGSARIVRTRRASSTARATTG